MAGPSLRITVEPWCSEFHQYTEKWMIGTFTTPTSASTALARSARCRSS